MKIVRVIWLDALAIAEWTRLGTVTEPQHCESVGFLVSESNEHVTVAATISSDEFTAAIQVPRAMIQSMVEIKEAQ